MYEQVQKRNKSSTSSQQKSQNSSGPSSSSVQRQAKKANASKTGLPDNLKAGIENLSGKSMDDVTVHYNSNKPAQVQALAYTQGKDIYVGPGQEKHLPHEAWHMVQQKQGRVQPTVQLGETPINDAPALEREADVMGAKAVANVKPASARQLLGGKETAGLAVTQFVRSSNILPGKLKFSAKSPFIKTGSKTENPQPEAAGSALENPQVQPAGSVLENPQQLTSGFSDSETESEIESQDNTPQYTTVAMGTAEKASIGEGLRTLGLTDCTAVAVLSNFDIQSQRYEEMGMFHIAGSHVESVGNTPGAMSQLQDLAKGEYTVVIVFGTDSGSNTMKSMIKEQTAIAKLLDGAKNKKEYTGSHVSIDRFGEVEVG